MRATLLRPLIRNPSLGLVGFVLAMLGLLSQTSAQVPAERLLPARLTFGMSVNSFSDVKRNDAEAAVKTFTDTVARKRGYQVDFKARVFEDAITYQTAIREGKVMAGVIDAWDYLGTNLSQFVEISFVKERQGAVGEQYLLLTRRGSGLNTLADLRGKELALLASSNAKLGRRWVDFLVLTNQFGDPAAFFSKVESLPKPSPVALPVFFGKRPACVLTRSAFDIMEQLNPQLGRELQIIEASPVYAESFLCMAIRGWDSEKFRSDFITGVLEMGNEPAGQQILSLFKADRFAPFQPAQLLTVSQLRADYDRLARKGTP